MKELLKILNSVKNPLEHPEVFRDMADHEIEDIHNLMTELAKQVAKQVAKEAWSLGFDSGINCCGIATGNQELKLRERDLKQFQQ